LALIGKVSAAARKFYRIDRVMNNAAATGIVPASKHPATARTVRARSSAGRDLLDIAAP
jgi:hypothetical protein